MRKFFLALAGVTVLALLHVQLGVSIIASGYRVEAAHRLKEQFLDLKRVLQYNVLTLRSPAILSSRLRQREIELVAPREIEILQPDRPPSPSAMAPQRNFPESQGRFRGGGWLQSIYRFAASLLEGGRQAEAKPTP